MKIIDLLVKIAKGEKIRFKDKYRSYDECDISTFLENYITANWDWVEDDTDWLNGEVENKEYEDIQEIKNKRFTRNQKQIAGKINQIIRNQQKIIEQLESK